MADLDNDADHDVHVGEAAAADFLNTSTRSLQRYRSEGGGPAYIRIGARQILYSMRELKRYKASRTFASRADELVTKAA